MSAAQAVVRQMTEEVAEKLAARETRRATWWEDWLAEQWGARSFRYRLLTMGPWHV